MNTNLRFSHYEIKLKNNQLIQQNIENLHILDEILRIYGRKYIKSIQFHFESQGGLERCVILKNTNFNDRFSVDFIRSKNYNTDLIMFQETTNSNDLNAVLMLLNKTMNLGERLGKYVLNPFKSE
jgi:hypothetical protein